MQGASRKISELERSREMISRLCGSWSVSNLVACSPDELMADTITCQPGSWLKHNESTSDQVLRIAYMSKANLILWKYSKSIIIVIRCICWSNVLFKFQVDGAINPFRAPRKRHALIRS